MSRRSYLLLGAVLLLGVPCFVGLLTLAPYFALLPLIFADEPTALSPAYSSSSEPAAMPAAPTQPPSQRMREVIQELRSTWKGSKAVGEALGALQEALASCGECDASRPQNFPGMTEALNRLIQAGAWNELLAFSLLVDQTIRAGYGGERHSLRDIGALAVSQYLHAANEGVSARCGPGAPRLQFVAAPARGAWAAVELRDDDARAQPIIWVGDLNSDGLPEFVTNDLVVWSACGGAAFERVSILPSSFRWFDHVGAEPGKGRRGWARLAGQVDPDERETVHLFDFDRGAYRNAGIRRWTDADATQLWGQSLDLPPTSPTDSP
jgi:hypothetical protein